MLSNSKDERMQTINNPINEVKKEQNEVSKI
jgi:hypothetical protein